MDHIINGIIEGIKLLISFDKEIWGIVFLSLTVSSSATIIAAVFLLPLGVHLGVKEFRGKKIFSRILYTSMSIPSVIVGLTVALLLSRKGPFGFLNLIYTVEAMVIAQMILVAPLILGLTFTLGKTRGKEIDKIGLTLGANKIQRTILILRETKVDIMVNVVTGFSRAISEVGAVMIVGGNIRGHTRVITTSISMMNSMGEYTKAIALGVVLITISLIVNSIIYKYSGDE